MKAKISKQLEELGMTTRISRVYLFLLQEGISGATKIARKLERPKSSVLDDLKWLAKQGFVSRHKKKNTYIFSADPNLLKSAFARKRKEIERMEGRAGLLATELQTMYQVPSKKPQIEYLEGKSGVRAAFDDILKYPGQEMIGYGDIESELTTLPKLFPEFYAMRTKLRIGGKGILPITPKTLEECHKNDKKHLRQSSYVGLDKYCPIGIYVYNDNVSIISMQELFAVIIRSKVTAKCMHNIFELAIKGAAEEDTEIRADIEQKGLKKKISEVEKEFKSDRL
jgi:predicted DNA-binding transcriptional regulator